MSAPHAIACLVLFAAIGRAEPELTVAYHRDDHVAPLFDACIYPKDFRARYGLYLKQVTARESYSLVDGTRDALSVNLACFDTDSAVLAALLSGKAQVGILGAEAVLASVLMGLSVRIIAPLHRAGDVLVVNPSVPAVDWKGFVAWVRAQTEPVAIGYVGQYSMAALGLAQALEYENVSYASTLPGQGPSPQPESAKVRLIRMDHTELASGLSGTGFDAAVLEEPTATWVGAFRGWHKIGRTDIRPPGRFEDHPGTIIASTDSAMRARGEYLGRFLELMAVATHYANNRTRNTLTAVCSWLGTSPALESIPLRNMEFSSRPEASFTTGIWNWYFALRLRNALPQDQAQYMEEKDWLGVPYDSLLLMPALDRAGARIIR